MHTNQGVLMNRLMSAKHLILSAAVAAAGIAAASSAHARSNVELVIGFPAPPVYVQPAPVYVQPAPVYVRPAPVYQQPQTVYYNNGYYNGYYGRDWGRDHRHHDRRGAWGDADRDGVPNRYDNAPNNPHRR